MRFGIPFPLIFFIFLFPIVANCSGGSSKDDRELLACWLRPSCQPSELPSQQKNQASDNSVAQQSAPPQTQPSKPSKNEFKGQESVAYAKAPTPTPAPNAQGTPRSGESLNCQTSAQTTVSAAHSSVRLSYTEPTTGADGTPLTNLGKTTVYYNLGAGFIKAKDIPATQPQGGGTVEETIEIPVTSSQPVDATICITATNTEGVDSAILAKAPTPTPAPNAQGTPRSGESLNCQTSAQTTVSAAHSSVRLSYTEPTTGADGTPLTNLGKTTVYYNLGAGFIKAKDIPATQPQGGGTVEETIEIPVTSSQPVDATICITATNTEGVDSAILAKAPTPTPAPNAQGTPRSGESLNCQTSAQTTVSAAHSSVRLSYTEPTTGADGTPLTNLGKTTVYYNLGAGFIKAKDIPATQPQGGGTVEETIEIPVTSSQPVDATICITATNNDGLESET